MWSRRPRLFRFVFERQLELGPGDQRPTVTDDDVVLGHLSHSEVTNRSPRRGDGLCRCFLPGGRTRSNHIDYPVHAHDVSLASVDVSMVVVPSGSVDGCPLLPVLARKQTPGVHDHAWKTDRTSPALEAVHGVVAGQRPLYGLDAHRHQLVDVVHHADLGSPPPWSGWSGQYLRESYPLRAPIWRPNVAGASTWKGVVGLVNNQRTCEVAAH